jgi:ATP-dependent exoDNAse (exonuclease V) beta subunit
VIGGIGFYEEDEIQALMNVLFFLWNRDDTLAFAAALKSPLFGHTDEDLFDLMQNDAGPLDALERLRPADGKRFHDWINLAGLMPLSGLLHRIVNDTGAYLRFGRRNPQALFNIDKLLDTAREFDRRGYTTLQDFVERVKNIRRTEQREASADLNLPGFQGSVNIMTVHKAKGLEYPIVFLPGMNQQPKSLSAGPSAIIEDGKNGIRMAIKDDASPVYDELWEREKGELLREHQRLLYVAMTRARDHLVLIGALGDGKTAIKQNTWLGYVHETATLPLFEKAPVPEAGMNVYQYPSSATIQARTMNLDSSGKDGQQGTASSPLDVKAVINNLSPVHRSETPEWKTATDFILQEKDAGIERPSLQADPRVISPLTRGSVLHRCLEEHTITGAYDLDRIMKEYPDLRALGNEVRQSFASDAGSVLKNALNNKEHAWIFERRPDSYSELPFLYKRAHDIVSGKIDRVVVKGGKGYVIDFKAIFIENDEALKSWTDHYRPQVRIYCEAVKDIFALEDIEGYLLFLDSTRLEKCVST